MSATSGDTTSLHALPPTAGDAALAAVLLRDLAAALAARPAGHHGGVSARHVTVVDGHLVLATPGATGGPAVPASVELAEHTAPELFDGTAPDDRSDVYAAGMVALRRYLGSPPVAARATGRGLSTTAAIAAVRQAQRTNPARLGALPDPFRRVFALAVAKPRYLRPTSAELAALLDEAFAAAGPGALDAARERVRRLVLLAHAFTPATVAAQVPSTPAAHAEPLRVSLMPALTRPSGATRAALIAAVAVLATGGVVIAAAVGTSSSPSTPEAVSTADVDATSAPGIDPTATTPRSAVVTRTTAKPSSSAPAPATTDADDDGGSDDGGGYTAPAGDGGGYTAPAATDLPVAPQLPDPASPQPPAQESSSTPPPVTTSDTPTVDVPPTNSSSASTSPPASPTTSSVAPSSSQVSPPTG